MKNFDSKRVVLRLKNDLVFHSIRSKGVNYNNYVLKKSLIYSLASIYVIAQSVGAVEYTDCTSAEE